MTDLDDIPQAELDRATRELAKRVLADMEARMVQSLTAYTYVTPPEPVTFDPIYVPEKRSSWFEPYYAGAAVMPTSGLIQCSCDGGPDLRGTPTERAGWLAKMERAWNGYHRAKVRRNLRRRRYWSNRVSHLSRRYNTLFT